MCATPTIKYFLNHGQTQYMSSTPHKEQGVLLSIVSVQKKIQKTKEKNQRNTHKKKNTPHQSHTKGNEKKQLQIHIYYSYRCHI